MQDDILALRIGGGHSPLFQGVAQQLHRAEYAEMAQNPLMLSLLISIFTQLERNRLNAASKARGDDAKAATRSITRAQLYEIGISLMLYRTDSSKYAMRRGAEDKRIEEEISLLATPQCARLLETVAFHTHVRKVRDIKSEDMIAALQMVEGEVEDSDAAAAASSLDCVRVLNSLNLNVRAGRVPLFVCLSENYRVDSQLEQIVR